MPYEITVKKAPPQTVLTITTALNLSDHEQTASAFAAVMGELCGFAGSQGLAFAGPPFSIYSDFDEEEQTTVRICVPVANQPKVELPGRIELDEVPASTLATTIHRGPYHEVRPAYSALYGWIEEYGHTPSGSPRETYLNDPGEVAESDLLTEVAWPIE